MDLSKHVPGQTGIKGMDGGIYCSQQTNIAPSEPQFTMNASVYILTFTTLILAIITPTLATPIKEGFGSPCGSPDGGRALNARCGGLGRSNGDSQ